MDRPTWLLTIGILAVAVVALVAAVVSRTVQAPPDLSTPEGVASAYILAVQNREPDKAWGLLESPAAVAGPFARAVGGDNATPREQFRQEVLNSSRPGNRRLRVLGSTSTGATARVEIETRFVESGPFRFGGGGNPQTRVFELKQTPSGWRITTAPPLFDLI